MSALASTPTRDSTAAVLYVAGEGNRLAWEELIRRYGRLVRATALSFRLQPADVEDAVQNTWLRVLERMDSIRDPERLAGWLVTTASRECLALIKRARREAPDDAATAQLVAVDEEPEAAVVATEARRAVDAAVASLPGCRRRLIDLLFYQPEHSYAAVSEATGMPHGSIGPTRQRVLQELRGTLEQRGFGPQFRAEA